jgi:outer membrane protein OmpA-like peptidoglycan-associated protein
MGEPAGFSAGITITDHEILSCFWEFGDSYHTKGESVVYTFKDKGEVPVRMLVNIKDRETGKSKQICSEKRITVKGSADKPGYSNNSNKGTLFAGDGNIAAKKRYSAKDAIEKKAVFQVQIMSSKKNIPQDDPAFDNIRPEYSLKTFLRKEDNLYSYVIDEQLQFMAAYPAFRDALSRGFTGTKIITRIPYEADEIELWNFKRNFGSSPGVFFINKSFSLSTGAAPVLEQLVLILKRNPGMKILITAHTENSGNFTDDLMLSRRQSEKILEYLTGRGIDKNRLSSVGYGSARPVAPDYPESERRKNNRIDFIKVN